MYLKLLASASFVATCGGLLFAQCDSPAPVRELLQKPEFRRKFVETQAEIDARNAAFQKALADYPDNYFVLTRKLSSFEDSDEALAWAREEHRRHPGAISEMIE